MRWSQRCSVISRKPAPAPGATASTTKPRGRASAAGGASVGDAAGRATANPSPVRAVSGTASDPAVGAGGTRDDAGCARGSGVCRSAFAAIEAVVRSASGIELRGRLDAVGTEVTVFDCGIVVEEAEDCTSMAAVASGIGAGSSAAMSTGAGLDVGAGSNATGDGAVVRARGALRADVLSRNSGAAEGGVVGGLPRTAGARSGGSTHVADMRTVGAVAGGYERSCASLATEASRSSACIVAGCDWTVPSDVDPAVPRPLPAAAPDNPSRPDPAATERTGALIGLGTIMPPRLPRGEIGARTGVSRGSVCVSTGPSSSAEATCKLGGRPIVLVATPAVGGIDDGSKPVSRAARRTACC